MDRPYYRPGTDRGASKGHPTQASPVISGVLTGKVSNFPAANAGNALDRANLCILGWKDRAVERPS